MGSNSFLDQEMNGWKVLSDARILSQSALLYRKDNNERSLSLFYLLLRRQRPLLSFKDSLWPLKKEGKTLYVVYPAIA